MSFSFNDTAGASQSTAKPRLEGNKIHNVKLADCKIEDIQGVKDPTMTYRVIKINFENEDGVHEHTIFEPRGDDFQRTESEFTGKDGKVNKVPNPSNVETMMLFFKHAIDGFVPEVAAKIDSGEKSLVAKDWDELRKLVVKILLMGKGRENKLKLVKNKKGEAIIPGFFTGLTREGKPYVKNNFIGPKVAFTSYEIGRIQKEANSQPTEMQNGPAIDLGGDSSGGDGLDLNFSVDDL